MSATATEVSTTSLKAPESWEVVRDKKRQEQLSRIPEEWHLTDAMRPPKGTVDVRPVALTSGILTEREQLITGETYDATSLAEEISKGTFTATETITAFCKRAAICQQLCQALTEICFTEAIEKAKKLDEHFQKTGKTVGPLHGLPMSFKVRSGFQYDLLFYEHHTLLTRSKECFHIKGFDASNGYISRCFDPSTTTTPIIQLVEEAGAVVIAKTNVPQTMLVAECDNNVFGHTGNPVVNHLSCGGSSGGEGSLSAFRGNVLGNGTDVGGSIRYVTMGKAQELHSKLTCLPKAFLLPSTVCMVTNPRSEFFLSSATLPRAGRASIQVYPPYWGHWPIQRVT